MVSILVAGKVAGKELDCSNVRNYFHVILW